jgi:hypothetical protein
MVEVAAAPALNQGAPRLRPPPGSAAANTPTIDALDEKQEAGRVLQDDSLLGDWRRRTMALHLRYLDRIGTTSTW